MLTIDFDRLGVKPGDLVLDAGCGTGRHAREALRRGARVVALDRDPEALAETATSLRTSGGSWLVARGDALQLPFADAAFDRVIVSEVLEHIADDQAAMGELVRVLRPGGCLAVSVPRWFPEQICWALSDEYHTNQGGHVRIYSRALLQNRLRRAGLALITRHHSHALHAPYWWLKCALGVRRDDRRLAQLYHRALVWQMMRRPGWLLRLESWLNPLLGKSLVLYLARSAEVDRRRRADAA